MGLFRRFVIGAIAMPCLISVLTLPEVASAAKIGDSCKKAKTTTSYKVNGKKVVLVCTRVGKKLTWIKKPAPRPVVSCATGGACSIGDVSPSGGIVFYVSPTAINAVAGISAGGIYLEVAPNDVSSDTGWCSDTTHSITLDGNAFSTDLGAGARNTLIMTTGTADSITPACTTGAGVLTANLTVGTFSDWFLPSKDELGLIYANLKKHSPSLGGLADSAYWSSSEVGAVCKVGRMCSNFVWAQRFSDGGQGETGKGTRSKFRTAGNAVRAIRAFG
ncbi:MAG: hypothetical protein EXQ63_03395 [Ilumatobacteraceae bacterium]|nr:hypothetical protein [Ilumatobacteraceae bacterium]